MTTKIADLFKELYDYYRTRPLFIKEELDHPHLAEDEVLELKTLMKASYENAEAVKNIKDLDTALSVFETTKKKVKDCRETLKKLPKTEKNELIRIELWASLNTYADLVRNMKRIFEENNIKTMKGHSHKAPTKKCKKFPKLNVEAMF